MLKLAICKSIKIIVETKALPESIFETDSIRGNIMMSVNSDAMLVGSEDMKSS